MFRELNITEIIKGQDEKLKKCMAFQINYLKYCSHEWNLTLKI